MPRGRHQEQLERRRRRSAEKKNSEIRRYMTQKKNEMDANEWTVNMWRHKDQKKLTSYQVMS